MGTVSWRFAKEDDRTSTVRRRRRRRRGRESMIDGSYLGSIWSRSNGRLLAAGQVLVWICGSRIMLGDRLKVYGSKGTTLSTL